MRSVVLQRCPPPPGNPTAFTCPRTWNGTGTGTGCPSSYPGSGAASCPWGGTPYGPGRGPDPGPGNGSVSSPPSRGTRRGPSCPSAPRPSAGGGSGARSEGPPGGNGTERLLAGVPSPAPHNGALQPPPALPPGETNPPRAPRPGPVSPPSPAAPGPGRGLSAAPPPCPPRGTLGKRGAPAATSGTATPSGPRSPFRKYTSTGTAAASGPFRKYSSTVASGTTFPSGPRGSARTALRSEPMEPHIPLPVDASIRNPTLNLYPYSSPSLSSCSALCPLSMAISISIFISSPLPMDVPIQEPNVEPLSVPHPSLTQHQPSPHRCSHPKPNTEPFPAENAHRPHLTHQHFPVKAQHGASLCFHVETKPSLQWGEVQMGWDEGTAAVAPTSVPTTPNGGSALPYGVTPNTTLPYIKERPPSSPPKHSTRHPLHASSYISDNK